MMRSALLGRFLCTVSLGVGLSSAPAMAQSRQPGDRCVAVNRLYSDDQIIDACSAGLQNPRISSKVRADLLANRATALLRVKKPELAIADFAEASKLDPSNVRSFAGSGDAHSAKRNFDSAISAYTNALQLDPKNAQALLGRATALRSRSSSGDAQKAIIDFSELIKVEPGNAAAFNARGLANRGYDREKALADFSEAIRLDPSQPGYFFDRAEYRGADRDPNNLDLIIEDYTAGLRLEPNSQRALLSRARAYEAKKDYERAIADHRTLKSLGRSVSPEEADCLVSAASLKACREPSAIYKSIKNFMAPGGTPDNLRWALVFGAFVLFAIFASLLVKRVRLRWPKKQPAIKPIETPMAQPKARTVTASPRTEPKKPPAVPPPKPVVPAELPAAQAPVISQIADQADAEPLLAEEASPSTHSKPEAPPESIEPADPEARIEATGKLYRQALVKLERMHRRLLDVIKDEFDRRGRSDINSVQALLLYNIGDKELTTGELRTRGYYLGSAVSHNLKKLVEMEFLDHQRSRVDRRSVRIKLTAKGQEARDIIDALYQKHARTVEQVGGINADQFAILNKSLHRMERFWTDQILYRL